MRPDADTALTRMYNQSPNSIGPDGKPRGLLCASPARPPPLALGPSPYRPVRILDDRPGLTAPPLLLPRAQTRARSTASSRRGGPRASSGGTRARSLTSRASHLTRSVPPTFLSARSSEAVDRAESPHQEGRAGPLPAVPPCLDPACPHEALTDRPPTTPPPARPAGRHARRQRVHLAQVDRVEAEQRDARARLN